MKRLFLFIASIGLINFAFAQDDLQFIDNVAVVTAVDGFTDESKLVFVTPTIGETVGQTFPDRNITVYCTNGAMTSLFFQFDVYLNNGEYGEFQYRLDGGEVKTTQEWQSDDKVALFVSSEGFSDIEEIRDILSGTNVLVRATGYDYESDQARFDLANLKSVMAQVGCSYPQ